MASSRGNEPKDLRPTTAVFAPRTPGPVGINDHSDPNVIAYLGDTPGPLGISDHAEPHLSASRNAGVLLQPAALGVPPAISPIGLVSNLPIGPTQPNQSVPMKDAGWPPIPGNLEQPSLERAVIMFGSFSYEPAPKVGADAIRITDSWERDNIISVAIPQLITIPPYKPKTVRFHRLAAPQLLALWAAWEKAKLLSLVLTYLGSFTPRFIHGTKTLSNHAFGAAFDINVEWNKQGQRGALVGDKGSVRELVPLANEFGFYWGGHFVGRSVDAQHFEVAKIL